MARKRGTIVPTLGKFIDIQWYGKQFISWFGHGFATLREAEKFHAALGRAILIFKNHTRCEAVRYAYSFNEPEMFVCALQKGHRGLHNSRRDDDTDVTSLKWGKWADSVDGSDSKARLAYHKRKKEQRRRKKKAEKNKRRK